MATQTKTAGRKESKARSDVDRANTMAAFHPVQLATLVDTVPTGNQWLHEMKYDGYRVEVAVGGGEARAFTRSGLDWSDRFPGIVKAAAKLKVTSALIDGEAVVLDGEGRSRFQALQAALKGAPDSIDYFAFDLLELNGEDLTQLPLTERKKKLQASLPRRSARLRSHTTGSNGESSACASILRGRRAAGSR